MPFYTLQATVMTNNMAPLWSATPTPFLADGSLDQASIERLVERHINHSVTGLMVGGTCGEGPMMPLRQLSQLVSMIKKAAGDRLEIAVQVTDTSAAKVIENMRHIADAGADYHIIAAPWIVADFCNHDFIQRYFLEPLEQSTLPIGLYVRQAPPKMALDLACWLNFIAHPKVSLVKDSSGSLEYRQALADKKKELPHVTLLVGDEQAVIPSVAAGYDGGLLGTGILVARLIREGLNALQANDRPTADLWQERSNRLLHDIFRKDIGCWMSGLKYTLVQLGIFSTPYTHLTFPFNDEDRNRIDEALKREMAFLN